MSEFSLEKQFFTPTIRWYQTKEYITLNVEVYDAKNEIVKIMADNISFYAISKENIYKIDFNLYDNINVEESKYTVNDKSIRITLKKTSYINWNYLLKDKNCYKNNIKIDWNEWINDLDEEETNDSNQFDFQKIMESMKGMGGGLQQNEGEDEEYEECEADEDQDNNCCDENCQHELNNDDNEEDEEEDEEEDN